MRGREGTEGISILGFRVLTTCGGKGEGREQGGKGKQRGAKGVKGSEGISILGYRVPTTCSDKKFD